MADNVEEADPAQEKTFPDLPRSRAMNHWPEAFQKMLCHFIW